MNWDFMLELPVWDYRPIETGAIPFSEKVRHICRTDCEMYGRSRSCPPAVGSVDACRARCLAFPRALLLQTAWETADVTEARQKHEALTRTTEAEIARQSRRTMTLSAEACAACEICTWPNAPCRHPEQMRPCVESHGILVSELLERHGMEIPSESGWISMVSLIFFEEDPND